MNKIYIDQFEHGITSGHFHKSSPPSYNLTTFEKKSFRSLQIPVVTKKTTTYLGKYLIKPNGKISFLLEFRSSKLICFVQDIEVRNINPPSHDS